MERYIDCDTCQAPTRQVLSQMHVAGGRVQLKWQCQCCWQPIGGAEKQAAYPGWPDFPDFDQERRQGYWEERQRQREAERGAREMAFAEERHRRSAQWWRSYGAYMKSASWSTKRALVLQRAGGRCEARMSGCEIAAVQVHHVSYAHFGNEPLWELRAVCMNCHKALHPDNEAQGDAA